MLFVVCHLSVIFKRHNNLKNKLLIDTNEMFSLRTILTTLISSSIAGSLVALPVRANEIHSTETTADSEIILSQIDRGSRFDREPSDDLKNIVGMAGLAIGTGVVGYHISKAYKPSLASSFPTVSNSGNTTLMARVSPKLRRELLRLVHDRATANRLLSGTSNSHPGRNPNWIAEKVIYDLKRGR